MNPLSIALASARLNPGRSGSGLLFLGEASKANPTLSVGRLGGRRPAKVRRQDLGTGRGGLPNACMKVRSLRWGEKGKPPSHAIGFDQLCEKE
jgi:hypothetical protein